MEYDRNMKSRILIGVLLIAFGGLFILDNYGLLDFDIPYYFLTWEAVFVLIGLVLLVSSRHKLPGLIFIGIGLFNLFPDLWPLILITIGIYLILRRNSQSKAKIYWGGKIDDELGKEISEEIRNEFSKEFKDKGTKNDPDKIDDVSIFGGSTKSFVSPNFKGGELTAIFGGSEINLTECTLAEGNQVLDVTLIFGGTALIIPNEWSVDLDIVPIFGGFSDKRIKDPNLKRSTDKKLVVKGTVIFGGGEIKSFL